MRVAVFPDPLVLAHAAADEAASRVRAAIAAHGRTRIVAATGMSQLAFLDRLIRELNLDWSKVGLRHLDEYVGLPADHPASFRKYLRERLIDPTGIVNLHLIDGGDDPDVACEEVGRALAALFLDADCSSLPTPEHLLAHQ